jgi:hypothetical protein
VSQWCALPHRVILSCDNRSSACTKAPKCDPTDFKFQQISSKNPIFQGLYQTSAGRMRKMDSVGRFFLIFHLLLIDKLADAVNDCRLVDDAEDSITNVNLSCWSSLTQSTAAQFSLDGSFERLMDDCVVQRPTERSNRTVLNCGKYRPGAYTCLCQKNKPRSSAIIKPSLDPDQILGSFAHVLIEVKKKNLNN